MRLFLLTVFIFSHQIICGQALQNGKVSANYTYKHFTVADGLPQIQITYLFCDSKGFVWVGTKFGVARWDGKNFKVFTPKEGAAGRQVIHIAEMPTGEIVIGWIGDAFNIIRGDLVELIQVPHHWNVNGLYGFTSYNNNQILFYTNSFTDDKYLKTSVVAIYDIKKHQIIREIWLPQWWISKVTSNGDIITAEFDVYKNKPGTFYLYHLGQFKEKKNFGVAFSNFNYSQSPRLRFFANNDQSNLCDIYAKDGKLQLIKNPTGLDEPVSEMNLRYLNPIDSSQTVYCNINQDLIVKNKSEKYRLGKLSQMICSIKDKENNLWIGTENGVFCYYRFGFQEIQFNVQPGTLDAIWSMVKLKNDNYIYASYDKGFWKSIDQNKTWALLNLGTTKNSQELMSKGSFGSLALNNGGAIISTTMGFYYYLGGKMIPYSLVGKGAEVYAAWEDTTNNRVLISKYTYLFSLNLKTLKLDTVFRCPQLDLQTILHITNDLENNPIISGKGGACILKNGKWEMVKGAENIRTMTSVVDFKGSLWLGTAQQLTCVKEGTAYKMKHFPGRQLVVSMTTWNSKWLVVGGGFELIILDLEAFYKTGQELYQRYDAGSGFITSEGGQNSFLHEFDGSIWWPCSDKVIRFWPDRLLAKTNSIQQPVILSVLAGDINERNLVLSDSLYSGYYSVGKSFRDLHFEFATAAMNNHDNLVYRYRLKGLDTNWSESFLSGNAVYGGLRPGKYVFEVQSSMDGFHWSSITTSLPIVLPAWWYETIWFKIIGIVFSIAVVVFITWWMMRSKRKETERAKLINELQLKAIRSKALPHFSGNAFANIDFYIGKGDTENASRYLAILSRLHNITLMDSDKAARSLEDEINYVRMYLEMEKLRFEEQLNFSIKVDEQVNIQTLIPTMVLHTYAENAIKHGIKNKMGIGMIQINIQLEQGGVSLSVQDNGVGRTAAEHTGQKTTKQGLDILQKQIELYNQQNKQKIVQKIVDLTDHDGLATGTCFSIFIPYDYRYEL